MHSSTFPPSSISPLSTSSSITRGHTLSQRETRRHSWARNRAPVFSAEQGASLQRGTGRRSSARNRAPVFSAEQGASLQRGTGRRSSARNRAPVFSAEQGAGLLERRTWRQQHAHGIYRHTDRPCSCRRAAASSERTTASSGPSEASDAPATTNGPRQQQQYRISKANAAI